MNISLHCVGRTKRFWCYPKGHTRFPIGFEGLKSSSDLQETYLLNVRCNRGIEELSVADYDRVTSGFGYVSEATDEEAIRAGNYGCIPWHVAHSLIRSPQRHISMQLLRLIATSIYLSWCFEYVALCSLSSSVPHTVYKRLTKYEHD